MLQADASQQMGGVAAHIEAMQQRVQKVDAAIAREQTTADEADKSVLMAQAKAAAAHKIVKKHRRELLVMKRALGLVGLDAEVPPPAKKRPSGDTSAQQVILVTSDSLGDLLDQAKGHTSAVIFDLQGSSLRYRGAGNPTLSTDSITVFNGKIVLTSGQSFTVKGKDVVLDSVSVVGGTRGVQIVDSASLTMTECEVSDSKYGVSLVDSGSLVANDVTLTDCEVHSFAFQDKSSATLTSCKVVGAGKGGISMWNDSSMAGTRVTVSGTRVCVYDKAQMALTDSSLTAAPTKDPFTLHGEALLTLTRCAVDGAICKHKGANGQR